MKTEQLLELIREHFDVAEYDEDDRCIVLHSRRNGVFRFDRFAQAVNANRFMECATHGQMDTRKAWACPDCYWLLKRRYAALCALSENLSNAVGAHICRDYVFSKSTKGEDLFELCHRVDDHIIENAGKKEAEQ